MNKKKDTLLPPTTDVRKLPCLFSCFVMIISMNLFFSFPLPFLSNYLIEVRRQSTITTGVLIGGFSLVIALVSAFASRKLQHLPSRLVIGLCMSLLFGSSCVLMIDMTNTVFTVVLFLVRATQGLALALAEPKVVAAMSALYREKLGMITALYELGFSVALTVGPYLGGALYSPRRFYLPFVATGTITLISGTSTLLLVSSYSDSHDDVQSEYRVLSFPTVILGVVTMGSVASAELMVTSFLTTYMSEAYNTPESIVGIMMMVGGSVVAISTFLAGVISDWRTSARKYILIFGLSLLAIASGLLKLRTPWFVMPGVLGGLVETGSTVAQVAILPLLILHDREPDVEKSTERMTCIYNFGYFGGAFLGASTGGTLLSMFSFPNTCLFYSTFIGFIFFSVLLINLIMKGKLLNPATA